MSKRSIIRQLLETQGVRESRGQRTRQALLDAALRLMGDDKSFSSISLREVTREAGIVPTAFYRHFRDMEEVGLELAAESFRTLRLMLRNARADVMAADRVIRRSVEIVVSHVHANRLHFQFIARERYGGYASLRQAIRHEIQLFSAELATDLARFPLLDRWDTEDLQMVASLFVNAMVSIAEQILDAPPNRPEVEEEIMRRAEKQLVLIALAIPLWRSKP